MCIARTHHKFSQCLCGSVTLVLAPARNSSCRDGRSQAIAASRLSQKNIMPFLQPSDGMLLLLLPTIAADGVH